MAAWSSTDRALLYTRGNEVYEICLVSQSTKSNRVGNEAHCPCMLPSNRVASLLSPFCVYRALGFVQGIPLRKLLLNEESPQVAQLPRASNTQDRKLQQRPPDNSRIDTLANISELRLPLALENLLALDILQASVQVAHLLDHVLDLVLVRALDLGGVADGHVELELDAACGLAGEEEAAGRGHVGGREAEAVVTGVGGGEDEFAAGLGALGDDAVVVVEGFVDGYEDALWFLWLGWVWF